MRARLSNLWEKLRSSYWFVPSIMAIAAACLALGMVAIDGRLGDPSGSLGWIYTGGAEGARALLSSIATSVITVAGVVFSITVAALTLASSQFGPRLLRNFMRDMGNQVVLGTFIATYVYCLLVLRTIRGENGGDAFVPNLSVTVGVALAGASLGLLIYFIHHITRSMQASQVIGAVASELRHGIDHLFPDDMGAGGDRPAADDAGINAHAQLPPDFDRASAAVPAGRDGYVQLLDDDALMSLARRHDLVVLLLCRPGQYAVGGGALARAWPAGRAGEDVCRDLQALFTLGSERTPAQDVQFAFDQLVEVALRAMSPGINDPFTAITCIDRLGSALAHLASRRLPSPNRHDDDGHLRVVADPVTFEGVLEATVPPIRDHARGLASPQVSRRLHAVLTAVADMSADPACQAALRRHAALTS